MVFATTEVNPNVVVERCGQLLPNNYRFSYYHKARDLHVDLRKRARCGRMNPEGYAADGDHALLLLKGEDLLAWLTFKERYEKGTLAFHILQVQAARMHREQLPRNWCRILYKALMQAAGSEVGEIWVRPAQFSYWYHHPYKVPPKDVSALQERLRSYYNRLPRELGFLTWSEEELDHTLAIFPNSDPTRFATEMYHEYKLDHR